MFVNMKSVYAEDKKKYNKSLKQTKKIKIRSRVYKKEFHLVEEWINSFYDPN